METTHITIRIPRRILPVLLAFLLGIVFGGFLFGSDLSVVRAKSENAPAAATPTVNKKINADQVDNVHAAKTPAANKLLALDATAKFPDAAIPNTISRTTHNHFGQTWTGSSAVGLGVTNTSASNSSYSVLGTNANGDGVKGASTNHNGVYGTTSASLASGVYGENTGGGYGVAGRANGGWAMLADGNTTQTLADGGFVKAMAEIDAAGTIESCYNSQISPASATTVPCGITTSSPSSNVRQVDFGFDMSHRYVSITPFSGVMPSYNPVGDNTVDILFYDHNNNEVQVLFDIIVF